MGDDKDSSSNYKKQAKKIPQIKKRHMTNQINQQENGLKTFYKGGKPNGH